MSGNDACADRDLPSRLRRSVESVTEVLDRVIGTQRLKTAGTIEPVLHPWSDHCRVLIGRDFPGAHIDDGGYGKVH